jgi:hypothetical protein
MSQKKHKQFLDAKKSSAFYDYLVHGRPEAHVLSSLLPIFDKLFCFFLPLLQIVDTLIYLSLCT